MKQNHKRRCEIILNHELPVYQSCTEIEMPGGYLHRLGMHKESPFLSKDGGLPYKIVIGTSGTDKRTYQNGLAHEVAHVLFNCHTNLWLQDIHTEEGHKYTQMLELMVTLLAKSFIKPEVWNDEDHKRALGTYHVKLPDGPIPEINKGISLQPRDKFDVGELIKRQEEATKKEE